MSREVEDEHFGVRATPQLDPRLLRERGAVPFREVPLAALAKGTNTLRVLDMECADLSPVVASRLRIAESVRGVVVFTVDRDGVAERLGLKPRDVIFEIGSVGVQDVRALQILLTQARRKGIARIRIWREGEGILFGTITF